MAMNFVKDILRGKTLGRALFHQELRRHASSLSGRILDLASGSGSYHHLLPDGVEVVAGDVRGTGESIDFNAALPFGDASFEHVLLFNALYIAEDPRALMDEIYRVLTPHGSALIASPYLQNEMREPHDYLRFTSEGLERLFAQAQFEATLVPYGERFSVGANLLHPFWLLSLIRLPVYLLACGLDALIPGRVRRQHPAPIGYFCTLKKRTPHS